MNVRVSLLCAFVTGSIGVLSSASAFAQDDVERRARELRIYATGEITPDRYEVVGRPWVDSRRSTAWAMPTFATEEQALAALRTEAASRGANGLLLVGCLDQGRSMWSNAEIAFLCYGVAVRVRPG